MIASKQDALSALKNIRNTLVFGLVLSKRGQADGWMSIATETARFACPDGGVVEIPLGPMVTILSDARDRRTLTEEFENCLKRATLGETHEVIDAFCKATGQPHRYEAAAWYWFARIIRNVVSHTDGGTLNRWPKDDRGVNIPPVAWRNRTLDSSMVGSEIPFTLCEVFELLKDQMEFVESSLS